MDVTSVVCCKGKQIMNVWDMGLRIAALCAQSSRQILEQVGLGEAILNKISGLQNRRVYLQCQTPKHFGVDTRSLVQSGRLNICAVTMPRALATGGVDIGQLPSSGGPTADFGWHGNMSRSWVTVKTL